MPLYPYEQCIHEHVKIDICFGQNIFLRGRFVVICKICMLWTLIYALKSNLLPCHDKTNVIDDVTHVTLSHCFSTYSYRHFSKTGSTSTIPFDRLHLVARPDVNKLRMCSELRPCQQATPK